MPTLKLTKRNVDTLKPAAERFTAWDTDLKGFGLRITPSGERVYVLKYRIAGEQRWVTIGRHGSPWTPEHLGTRRSASWGKWLEEMTRPLSGALSARR
jgi:hypothetical protein